MDDQFYCDWCQEEKEGEGNVITSQSDTQTLCYGCFEGVRRCVDCRDIWTHTDVGAINNNDYFDKFEDYHCNDCAEYEGCCQACGQEVGKENLNTYSYSERNEEGYKQYHDDQLCMDCYEEHNPSIDPQQIAQEMTDEIQKQEEIVEAIQNNMDTHGEIWKQLKSASEDERWQIIEIMGIAQNRHENTNYDQLLRAGVAKDTARELIKV